MNSWRKIWTSATTGGVPMRALIVSIVVGTILNLINQGDALFTGAPLNWGKLILTFIVPYLVSTHGAVSVRESRRDPN
ncbi:MAG: nitrate/nitrite transporter NrtS [Parvibaculum sp.]